MNIHTHLQILKDKLDRATKKHGHYNSYHEGYAVILEELDELFYEVKRRSHARSHQRIYDESCDIAVAAIKMALLARQRIDSPEPVGNQEGDRCNRDGCEGRMGYEPVGNCSCHISPPCAACEHNPLVCLSCGAESDHTP